MYLSTLQAELLLLNLINPSPSPGFCTCESRLVEFELNASLKLSVVLLNCRLVEFKLSGVCIGVAKLSVVQLCLEGTSAPPAAACFAWACAERVFAMTATVVNRVMYTI